MALRLPGGGTLERKAMAKGEKPKRFKPGDIVTFVDCESYDNWHPPDSKSKEFRRKFHNHSYEIKRDRKMADEADIEGWVVEARDLGEPVEPCDETIGVYECRFELVDDVDTQVTLLDKS